MVFIMGDSCLCELISVPDLRPYAKVRHRERPSAESVLLRGKGREEIDQESREMYKKRTFLSIFFPTFTVFPNK